MCRGHRADFAHPRSCCRRHGRHVGRARRIAELPAAVPHDRRQPRPAAQLRLPQRRCGRQGARLLPRCRAAPLHDVPAGEEHRDHRARLRGRRAGHERREERVLHRQAEAEHHAPVPGRAARGHAVEAGGRRHARAARVLERRARGAQVAPRRERRRLQVAHLRHLRLDRRARRLDPPVPRRRRQPGESLGPQRRHERAREGSHADLRPRPRSCRSRRKRKTRRSMRSSASVARSPARCPVSGCAASRSRWPARSRTRSPRAGASSPRPARAPARRSPTWCRR